VRQSSPLGHLKYFNHLVAITLGKFISLILGSGVQEAGAASRQPLLTSLSQCQHGPAGLLMAN